MVSFDFINCHPRVGDTGPGPSCLSNGIQYSSCLTRNSIQGDWH